MNLNITKNTKIETLIKLAKEKNEEAFNMLLFHYNGTISCICIEFLQLNKRFGIFEYHELVAEAESILYYSLKYYNSQKSSFKTFLNLVVKNGLKQYVAKQIRRTTYLQGAVNFDELIYELGTLTYEEITEDKNSSIQKWYETEEEFKKLFETDEKYSSKTEREILLLRAAGYTTREIRNKYRQKRKKDIKRRKRRRQKYAEKKKERLLKGKTSKVIG